MVVVVARYALNDDAPMLLRRPLDRLYQRLHAQSRDLGKARINVERMAAA